MNQDLTGQQDSGSLVVDNSGFSTTKGYATGATVPMSGTYRASNKYMDIIQVYAAGEIFMTGADGKKTTWYALAPTLSTNTSGSFDSVKVAPGTI